LSEAPRRTPISDFKLDAGVIEAGLRKQLARPSLPLHERIQYLGACATLANTRGDFETAAELQGEQLGLCEQSGDPAAALLPWLGIGDSYYARKLWPEADAAYSNALALAL